MKVTSSRRKPPTPKLARITDYKQAIERMRRITDWDQEALVVVTMLPDYRIIDEHVISIGGFHDAPAPLQVIFERVITDKAKWFIIGHNHTNGVGIPSPEDFQVVMKIITICEFMEVDLLDSIIFPNGFEPMSMKSKFPETFKRFYTEPFNEMLDKFIPRKVKAL